MKNLRTAVLCISTMFLYLSSSAQKNDKPPVTEPDYNKPRLFDNLPKTIPVNIVELNTLLSSEVGSKASIGLSAAANIKFDGDVVSSASKYGNSIKSVVVRSSNFNGAQLTISRTTSPEGVVSYVGRIISFQHGDLYELQNQNGQFVLVKKNYHELINE
ncbi:hypothetical protein CAP36_10785 [Chitinophagaceae bacterium IBVUCB2]|nr:hypothetical protein CAP36_10785 [Chitinophagaceae bacterium IBVUCB2]